MGSNIKILSNNMVDIKKTCTQKHTSTYKLAQAYYQIFTNNWFRNGNQLKIITYDDVNTPTTLN